MTPFVGCRVVVAEDEPKIRRNLVRKIAESPFRCEVVGTAANGAEALEVVRSAQPDVLVTDIRMPKLDGLALIRQALIDCPDMQVIIVSGYSDFEYAQQAMKLGVRDYLVKPVSTEALYEILENVLTQTQRKASQIERSMLASDLAGYGAAERSPILRDERFMLLLVCIGNLCPPFVSPEQTAFFHRCWSSVPMHDICREAAPGQNKWWVVDEKTPNQKFLILAVGGGSSDDARAVRGRSHGDAPAVRGESHVGARAVGGGSHDDARTVGDGSHDDARAVGGGSHVGARTVGDGSHDDARAVGGGLHDDARAVGGGSHVGALAVGGGLHDSAKTVAEAVLAAIGDRVPELPVSVAYTSAVIERSGIWEQSKALRLLLDRRLIIGRSGAYGAPGSPGVRKASTPVDPLLQSKLAAFIQTGETHLLRQELLQAFAVWQDANYPQRLIEMAIGQLARMLHQQVGALADEELHRLEYETMEKLAVLPAEAPVFPAVWSLLEALLPPNDRESDAKLLADRIAFDIRTRYTEAISLDELAQKYHFTPPYLSKLFKKYYGEAPLKYLIRLRMEAARQMLLDNPQLEVGTVGEIVGYADQHYFSRIFKNTTGLSPSEFKELARTTGNNRPDGPA